MYSETEEEGKRRRHQMDTGSSPTLSSHSPLTGGTGRRRDRPQPPHAQLLPSPSHHRRCHPVRPFLLLLFPISHKITQSDRRGSSSHVAPSRPDGRAVPRLVFSGQPRCLRAAGEKVGAAEGEDDCYYPLVSSARLTGGASLMDEVGSDSGTRHYSRFW